MGLLSVLAIYCAGVFVVAFGVAFAYQIAIKRPFVRALHWAALFGLFAFIIASIALFLFGVPDLSGYVESR